MIHIIIVGIKPYFEEFGNALTLALHSMGYKKVRTFFYLKKSLEKGNQKVQFSPDCNIICTPQQVPEKYILPNNKSIKIWIHTEQKPRDVTYEQWDRVLTFFNSVANSSPMIYFPMGYSTAFNQAIINGKNTNGHNLFSFGAFTKYRREVCKKFNIIHRTGIYGNNRDSMIKHSKINVNIKAYDGKYFFAPLHALHVLCYGKLLFQQKSNGDYSIYKPYIIEFNEDDFIEKRDYWLQNNEERNQFGKDMLNNLMNNLNFNNEFAKCMKGVL